MDMLPIAQFTFMTSTELALAFGKWRRENGVTLRDVEKHTNISNAFLSQFENHPRGISFDKAQLIIKLMRTATIEKTARFKGVIK